MSWLLVGSLFLVNACFYLLASSFESFSRISLANFIKDFAGKHRLNYYYVEKYDLAFHTLKTFVFFLQILLLAAAFLALQPVIPDPTLRLLAVAAAILLLFNTLLHMIGYRQKELVFKKLFFLFPVAWYVFYPVNRLFSLFIREARGEEKEEGSEDLSEEKMEVFFEESEKEGVIEAEDQEMIQSVIEFGDTLVREVMQPRVDMASIPIGAGLGEIIDIISRHKKSRYPVISGKIDNVEGVILAKDLFSFWNGEGFDIRDVMRPPFFVPETMRVFELLKEMQKSKQKFAIVVDEFGGVSGCVTMEDVIEEIVGDIKDEYDDDSEPIIREKDHFLARGDANIYELTETLGLECEADEDYQTVAGLISFRLGRIGQVHDRVPYKDWVFEVQEVEKNRIKKVKIFHEKK